MCRETLKYFINTPKLLFGVACAKFIDTPCCINKFHFTCVERMRGVRNFKFNKRILVAIFPFNGFAGIDT